MADLDLDIDQKPEADAEEIYSALLQYCPNNGGILGVLVFQKEINLMKFNPQI